MNSLSFNPTRAWFPFATGVDELHLALLGDDSGTVPREVLQLDRRGGAGKARRISIRGVRSDERAWPLMVLLPDDVRLQDFRSSRPASREGEPLEWGLGDLYDDVLFAPRPEVERLRLEETERILALQ